MIDENDSQFLKDIWNEKLVNSLLNRKRGAISPLSIILGHKPKYYASDQDAYNI